MDAQLAARRELVAAGREQRSSQPGFDAALSAFDPLFFGNLLVALEASVAGIEGTADGPVRNELRTLCHSIVRNRGVLALEPGIEYDAGRSVLGIGVGQEILLTEADFVRLVSAYFIELEARFAAE